MIRKTSTILIAVVSIFLVGCSADRNQPAENSQAKNTPNASPSPTKEEAKSESTPAEESSEKRSSVKPDKSACLNFKMPGKRLIASQTFVFDTKSFPNSCFVTFASKEDMVDATDVPRGSTFHIYQDGELVFDFDDAFDDQQGCWVEAVGFQDLNGDRKPEVIVAGSCLAARDSYPANAVYISDLDEYHTYPKQNELLADFKTVAQIISFVKKNPGEFR